MGGSSSVVADDIKIDGVSLEGFDPSVKEYAVPSDTISGTPEITADAAEGITVTSNYDADTKTATLTCTKDEQENVYTIHFGSRPQSDEFDSDVLCANWTVENPNENWELADGHLTIHTEGGSFYQDQNNSHNQVVQQAYGDWESITKLDVEKLPYANYQSLGVVAKQDDDNYINLKAEWSTNLSIGFTQEVNGTRTILAELPTAQLAKFDKTVYFKLTKKGNTYTAAVSPDGETYIRLGAKATANYTNPLFSLSAGNGSAENADSMAANYDYVRFTPNPTAPVISIGDSTKLKVAEAEPSEITSTITQEDCEDEDGGFDFGNCNKGEYAVYDVNVEKTGVYDFTARMASGASETSQAKFIIYIDDEEAANFVVSGTGGWQNWITSDPTKVRLTAGEHKLKVYIDLAGLNLNWIQMDLATELNDAELKTVVEAADGKDISSYPAVRQEAFKKALADAKSALANAKSQEDINAALKALKDADTNLAVATPITDIKLDVKSLTLNPGTSVQVGATAAPADCTEALVWSSSDEKVVTVKDGLVTAVADGTATITVSNGGSVKTTMTVVVGNAKPVENTNPGGNTPVAEGKSYINDVKASLDKNTLYYGGNAENTAAVTVTVPNGAVIDSVDYATSNAKAAIVNAAGKITAKGAGSAKVTAKVNLTNGESKEFRFDVTVKKAEIQKVKVPAKVKKGKKVTLKAKALGSTAKITWKLKNPSTKVAKLTSKGKFTAKKKGKVKVVATSGNVKKTFTIKVK